MNKLILVDFAFVDAVEISSLTIRPTTNNKQNVVGVHTNSWIDLECSSRPRLLGARE